MDIKNTFQKDIPLIVDGGNMNGTSSTIIDVSKRTFRILRNGSYLINFDAISRGYPPLIY